MNHRVLVRVPGSVANLGAGFDCVAAAVDLWLRVSASLDESLGAPVLERGGTLAPLATPAVDDHIWVGFASACRRAGRAVPAGVHLRASSDIPISRGLGSSAAAIVAGAAAANSLLHLGLDDHELVVLCAEIETHADNVAAAVYGGTRLVLSDTGGRLLGTALPLHPSLALAFAIPEITTATVQARAALPATLPRGGAALDDVLRVPFRRDAVPGYGAVISSAVAAGGIGATLSGSGPTIVAVTDRAVAHTVAEVMCTRWRSWNVEARPFVNPSIVPGYDAVVRVLCAD